VNPPQIRRLSYADLPQVIAIERRAALTVESDKLAGGLGLGPRLLISEAALRATGLLQPGSLVRWQYRLRLPAADTSDRAVTAVEKAAQSAFPDAGWEVRTRSKASPQLARNVERFTQFLTLVGLTTLLVGGVGVANAVAAHLARQRIRRALAQRVTPDDIQHAPQNGRFPQRAAQRLRVFAQARMHAKARAAGRSEPSARSIPKRNSMNRAGNCWPKCWKWHNGNQGSPKSLTTHPIPLHRSPDADQYATALPASAMGQRTCSQTGELSG